MIYFERVDRDEIEGIYQINKLAFEHLYNKYHDELSPFNESISSIQEKYVRPNNYYFKIKKNLEAIGYIRIVTNSEKTEARIAPIAIKPDYLGFGYGTRAMALAEETFSTVERWYLDTILQEAELIHFYSKLGYEKTGEVEAIQKGMDLIYFIKNTKQQVKEF